MRDQNFNESFRLTKYYHAYIVEYGNDKLLESWEFFCSTLMEERQNSGEPLKVLSEKERQKLCHLNPIKARIIPLTAGLMGIVVIVHIAVEKAISCLGEGLHVLINFEKKTYKLWPYLPLIQINELIMMICEVGKKNLDFMITGLINPQNALNKLSNEWRPIKKDITEKDPDKDNNIDVDYARLYHQFLITQLTDRDIQNQREKGVNFFQIFNGFQKKAPFIAACWVTHRFALPLYNRFKTSGPGNYQIV